MDTTKDPAPTARLDTLPVTVASTALPLVPGYEVLALVGRGGMGRVYRAKHLTLGRVVALKLLSHEPDDRSLARFREEVRAVAQLQHPNIAQLFETGVADGQPFFTQEFLDGGSLAQSFARKPQDSVTAARVIETIARAIQHSHEHGILHRDLKPANILLASDGTPKVTDFGLAKSFSTTVGDPKETAPDPDGLTRTGEILGTPAYMPPEQASGVLSLLGPPADVYGLGAILYEALTGRPPFLGPDAFRTVMMVREMEPISPRVLQPDVPRDLETICLKCLAKEPHKRYATAGALADDLRRFLNREPILARPVGRWERTVKWARRRPWQAAAAILAVALVVGLAVGFVLLAEKNSTIRNANNTLQITNAALATEKEIVEAEKHRAEQTLRLSLHALNRYFFAFSDRLKELPKSEKLRLEVLSNARGTLDDLNKFQPDNHHLQRFRMEGYDRLGNIESQLGNLNVAEGDYTKARDIAASLAARFPEDVGIASDRLMMTAKIAAIHLQRGEAKQADALLDGVIPEMETLAASHPENVSVLTLEVLVRQQLLGREVRHGRWEGVEAEMRRMCALHRRWAKAEPDNSTRSLDVINADRQLATLLIEFGKLDEGSVAISEVLRGLAALPEPMAASVNGRKLRAIIAATVGTYFQRREVHGPAFVAFAAAMKDYAALAAEFPDSPLYRYQQADTLWYLAASASSLGNEPLAVTYMQQTERLLAALMKEYPDDRRFRDLHERVLKLLKPTKPKGS